jgi:hypothetical protein
MSVQVCTGQWPCLGLPGTTALYPTAIGTEVGTYQNRAKRASRGACISGILLQQAIQAVLRLVYLLRLRKTKGRHVPDRGTVFEEHGAIISHHYHQASRLPQNFNNSETRLTYNMDSSYEALPA